MSHPRRRFYEWRKNGDGSKTPVWIHHKDGEPFAFASLWEVWRRGPDEMARGCTIITTAANDFMRETHSRMPVVLDDELAREWLTPEAIDPAAALAMLVPSESATRGRCVRCRGESATCGTMMRALLRR